MAKRYGWLMIGLIGMATADADPGNAWHRVRGDSLQVLFADQDLGDGVHYAYQFHRDGALSGMNMGKPARGTWKVTGPELCYRWNQAGSEEECYEVRRRGHDVRMFRDGYEAFSGTLTPLQPQLPPDTPIWRKRPPD
ncbi:MAG TPA: hypothetical protein VFF03_07165 [Rhodocyclaceae bacterium]|nr:hypothetical protein [Rhodocyclaceae bacterium]